MFEIAVVGAGAFGTALAISYAASGKKTALWTRSSTQALALENARENTKRLPGFAFPEDLTPTPDLKEALNAKVVLLAIPMQQLGQFATENSAALSGKTLICCCKGIDLKKLQGPTEIVARAVPDAQVGLLSGPSFAQDIAAGLPTAFTLALPENTDSVDLLSLLSSNNLRPYLSHDLIGVEMGGALKNVIAIACGLTIGAGLGESARAALMTRGYAELQKLAATQGAAMETLAGLSGFGDLALTCTSEKSRNYRYGLALGAGHEMDSDTTVEGVATARAVSRLATQLKLDLPIAAAVCDILDGHITIAEAADQLLSRPLKEE